MFEHNIEQNFIFLFSSVISYIKNNVEEEVIRQFISKVVEICYNQISEEELDSNFIPQQNILSDNLCYIGSAFSAINNECQKVQE